MNSSSKAVLLRGVVRTFVSLSCRIRLVVSKWCRYWLSCRFCLRRRVLVDLVGIRGQTSVHLVRSTRRWLLFGARASEEEGTNCWPWCWIKGSQRFIFDWEKSILVAFGGIARFLFISQNGYNVGRLAVQMLIDSALLYNFHRFPWQLCT